MKPRVMIVDDDPLMHLLYMKHLEKAGYQTIAAKDGSEVVGLASQELPALIIMDVMMEPVDGFTALRELKRVETTQRIPVLVVTANVSTHVMVKLLAAEAQIAGA